MASKNPLLRIEDKGDKIAFQMQNINGIELRDMLMMCVFRGEESGHMLGAAILDVAEKIKAMRERYEAEKQK